MQTIFARITKVDEETRTVTGRAAQEITDRDGECMDYASSKPNFQAWSAEVFADTDGKSHGNVRAMHGNIAAGILSDIEFNDVEKSVDVVATITDDQEWKKVTSGTYSGFSIGGRYARKWSEVQNGKMVQRYTAMPSEISLVDRPCIPTAKFFSIHKRDGRVVKRAFANQEGSSMMSDAMVDYLKMDKSHNAIRAIHARGSQRLPPDFLHKYESTGSCDATVNAIHKAHGAAGQRPVYIKVLKKMIANGRMSRLIKAGMPPQSSNAQWNDVHANTGASNSWRDQIAPTAKPTRIGGQVIGAPSQSNKDAAVDAIKRDFARGAKRMGA